jgi:hypothetical protein
MWQINYRVIGVASVLWLIGAQASPKPAISISISTPHTTVHIGEAITIRVELKNTSKGEIKVASVVNHEQAELNYQMVMLDSAGHPVPLTNWGKAVAKRQVIIVSLVVLPLAPGKTWVETTELTKLFEITKPGTYTVRAGRKWPETKTGKMEWSNALTLTVTP